LTTIYCLATEDHRILWEAYRALEINSNGGSFNLWVDIGLLCFLGVFNVGIIELVRAARRKRVPLISMAIGVSHVDVSFDVFCNQIFL
jgi:hypothetical protein